MKEGCGVLFKNGSGIIICGEKRVDGNCFLCKRCLKNDLMELKDLRITQEFLIKTLERKGIVSIEIKKLRFLKSRRPKKTRVTFWASKPSKYIKKRKKK